MNIQELTIGQAQEIVNLFNSAPGNTITAQTPQPIAAEFIGKVCVFRTYSAGVHIGTLKAMNGTQAVIENSKRLWRWEGAFSLSEVSQKGVADASRIAVNVPLMLLTEVIEVLPATPEAIATFEPRNN